MSTLLLYQPGGQTSGSIARLVWSGSQALLQSVRLGRRDLAIAPATFLVSTREDPRCTPTLGRTIDRALEIAMTNFGGVTPTFEPLQPNDGEAA